MLLPNDISLNLINVHLRQFLSVSKYVQSHRKIKGKTLDNWLHFYLSEPYVLAKAAGCKSCRLQKLFCTDTDFTEQAFHMWKDMLMKYSSLKCSEFILAFQVQFGTYEAESEHFRSEKEKHHFNEWFSR